jgi:hypothetical protein
MLQGLQTRSRRRTQFFDLVAQEGDIMQKKRGFLQSILLIAVPFPPSQLLNNRNTEEMNADTCASIGPREID